MRTTLQHAARPQNVSPFSRVVPHLPLSPTKSIGLSDMVKRTKAALMPIQLSPYLNYGDDCTLQLCPSCKTPARGKQDLFRAVLLSSCAEWGWPLHLAVQQMLRRFRALRPLVKFPRPSRKNESGMPTKSMLKHLMFSFSAVCLSSSPPCIRAVQ